VAGNAGHRALSATFVRDTVLRAPREQLAYLAVHDHFDDLAVAFSGVDPTSH
jgi:hypothetical protein